MKSLIAYLIISAFVGVVDILPLLFKRHQAMYCLSVFLQVLFVGVVIFYITLPLLPWYLQGPVIAFCLALPEALHPVRKGYPWYLVLINALAFGFAISFIKNHIGDIMAFLGAAA